jgi:heme-degrading monooxygenase HmoA
VLPQLRALPGFLGISLMQAQRGDRVEIVVSSRWDSMGAIRAFAGPAPEQAVVEPAAREVLVEFDDVVSHYDVVLEAGVA